MSPQHDSSQGWFVGRQGASEWKGGPYTWAQLVAFAREGRIEPGDLVWHPGLADWTPAEQIPNLLGPAAAPAPAYVGPANVAAAPSTGAAPATPAPSPSPRSRSRAGLWIALGIAGVLFLGGIGAGAWMLLRSGAEAPKQPSLGAASFTPPDPANVQPSPEWGPIPTDYIAVVMKPDAGRPDAEKVAAVLGGKIIGEVEFARIYQLSIPPKGVEGVRAALATAEKQPGVLVAAPDQLTTLEAEGGSIEGTQCTPLNEPPYLPDGVSDNGWPYKMIGVQNAWDIVRGSGVELNPVQVGVVDNPLLRSQGEFDGAITVRTALASDATATPEMSKGAPVPYGTHGTAVTGIIAADPDNGGVVGVASVLGERLTVDHTNVFSPTYSSWPTVTPDPFDPTQYWNRDGAWAVGELVAMTKTINAGSTILSNSWRGIDQSEKLPVVYREFYKATEQKRPDVLFVCCAGNDYVSINGKKFYPGGFLLNNVVTVGCLDNDGKRINYSNMNSKSFEVSLAAPGHRVLSGIGPDGKQGNVNGGTSFATPQVTATAAMMRAIDPRLSASNIKAILVDTGRTAISIDSLGLTRKIEPSVGGRVLASDLAVLEVLNNVRAKQRKPELTLEQAVARGRIALSANPASAGAWTVGAALDPSTEGAHALEISGKGQQGFSGSISQKASGDKPVNWGVTAKDSATVHVKRPDNGACSRVRVGGSLVGKWKGTRYKWEPGGVISAEKETFTIGIAETGGRYFGDITIDYPGGSATFALGLIKFDGTNVTMDMSGAMSPLSPTDFKGTLEGDTLTGTDSYPDGASQPVTLTRVE